MFCFQPPTISQSFLFLQISALAHPQREHLVTSAPEAPKGRTVDGRSFTHPQVVVLGTGKVCQQNVCLLEFPVSSTIDSA